MAGRKRGPIAGQGSLLEAAGALVAVESTPSPPDEPLAAHGLYVEMAEELGLKVPRSMRAGDARYRKLKARLRDAGGLEGWKAALDKVRKSGFLRGEKGGRDRWNGCHIDFLLQESSFTRVLEGVYDDNPRAGDQGFDQRRRTVREGVAGALGLGPRGPGRVVDEESF